MYVRDVSMEAQTIQQAYRFALDPTVEQEQFLAACAGAVGHGREIEDVADLVQERGALPSPVDPP